MRHLHWIALTALAAVALIGCGGAPEPIPASRLVQPAGQFSFVTPDGWSRTKLAGIDGVIVSTEPDAGAHPNIYAGRVVSGVALDDAARAAVAGKSEFYPSYVLEKQTHFVTRSGLQGIRISGHRRNKDALQLASFQYLVADGDRVIDTICICAYAVRETYEPVFDEAMASLQSERPPREP